MTLNILYVWQYFLRYHPAAALILTHRRIQSTTFNDNRHISTSKYFVSNHLSYSKHVLHPRSSVTSFCAATDSDMSDANIFSFSPRSWSTKSTDWSFSIMRKFFHSKSLSYQREADWGLKLGRRHSATNTCLNRGSFFSPHWSPQPQMRQKEIKNQLWHTALPDVTPSYHFEFVGWEEE